MSEVQYFRPRNWGKFQHYGKRNPPWIKLHKSTLRDRDFNSLTMIQQLVCMKLWLLYADLGRPLVWDCSWLGLNIGVSSNCVGKALPALLSSNFIELCDKTDSVALAECKQNASPETETETETDIQTPTESSAPSAPGAPPDDLKAQVFGPCLRWLAGHSGKPEKSLRPLVGRWCRDYGDDPVVDAMVAGQRASPVEPVAYVERLLKSGGPKNGAHSAGRQAALEDEVDRMVSQAAEAADRREHEQHSQAGNGSARQDQLGFRSAAPEDSERPAQPEVRGAGGNLR